MSDASIPDASPILLDTSAVSSLIRGAAGDERLQAVVAGHPLLVSFVTVGELLHGAARAHWANRRLTDLEKRIAAMGVIPGTIVVARQYAFLKAKFGTSKQDNDLWVAASAMIDQPPVPIVTLDSDFDELGTYAGIEIIRPNKSAM